MPRRTERSPWVYIGCGCAALAGAALVAAVVAGFYGYSSIKGWQETLEDPVARDRRARAMLGAEKLPEGFHAHLFFRFPLVLDLVVLREGPPAEKAFDDVDLAPGQSTVVYFEIRDFGDDREEMRRFLAGEIETPDFSFQTDFDFRPSEPLARGAFESGGDPVLWAAHRGRFRGDGERYDGLLATAMFDCPGDTRLRFAVWFLRLGDPAGEPDLPDLTGTPADEAALRDLLAHFDVCPG